MAVIVIPLHTYLQNHPKSGMLPYVRMTVVRTRPDAYLESPGWFVTYLKTLREKIGDLHSPCAQNNIGVWIECVGLLTVVQHVVAEHAY